MAIRHVLEDQIERSERNIAVYRGKLEKLPKGILYPRKRGDKIYYYLKYRDDSGKRVDQYIKADQVEVVKKQLSKRKEYIAMICGLQEDIKIARKGLR
ncbi:MAG TPA: hypothetical protein DCX03_07900 [Bacteroidales bacterium]|nr:hypothetical protein [Bacteroidales bacterium]